MNQPDLGEKVTQLRQGKGFTQEQLAEVCEVSQRTIQRIERGDVDPRSHTLQCLSEALDFDFLSDFKSGENLWLTVLHLSSILSLVVIPLLLWAWKKDQSSQIDRQARLVVSFQITMALALFANLMLLMVAATIFIFLGQMGSPSPLPAHAILIATGVLPFPMILIGIFCTYQGVVNSMRAMSDRPIHYPLSIPFMK